MTEEPNEIPPIAAVFGEPTAALDVARETLRHRHSDLESEDTEPVKSRARSS